MSRRCQGLQRHAPIADLPRRASTDDAASARADTLPRCHDAFIDTPTFASNSAYCTYFARHDGFDAAKPLAGAKPRRLPHFAFAPGR